MQALRRFLFSQCDTGKVVLCRVPLAAQVRLPEYTRDVSCGRDVLQQSAKHGLVLSTSSGRNRQKVLLPSGSRNCIVESKAKDALVHPRRQVIVKDSGNGEYKTFLVWDSLMGFQIEQDEDFRPTIQTSILDVLVREQEWQTGSLEWRAAHEYRGPDFGHAIGTDEW